MPSTPAESTPSGGERRQLTVMFADLVGSTELSTQMDPEDLQDVIRAYQEKVAEIVKQYDGYVAKYMGDGVLVYFGYPQAQERDAERAVLSGLAIIEAMAGLSTQVGADSGLDLAVRIGVARGLVVVGEVIGQGTAEELTVVGETPNLAARLQALAAPNCMVISTEVKDLVAGAFTFDDMGEQDLKGISEPAHAWQVLGRREEEEDEFELSGGGGGEVVLMGRDEEIGLLARAWANTKDSGVGQAVMVNGEPGIGKSTLVENLRVAVRNQKLPRLSYRCSPYHANSALFPVIEHVKRVLGWKADDEPEERVDNLEKTLSRYTLPLEETVRLLLTLFSQPLPMGSYQPLTLTPQVLKQQTMDMLVAWMLEEAERQPILAVWEDLHWADPTTLEILAMVIDQAPTVPMLVVMTYRPDFTPTWTARSHISQITLNRLERPQIEALVTRVAQGRALPEDVVEHIVRKTDGVPLYVEELTKTILTSDILREEEGQLALSGPLSEVAIPASLQESLMARLDRLPTVREIAQLGAVLGREFAYEMLRAIAPLDDSKLQDGLGQLVEAELLYQRGRPPRSRYIFKHALVQDAAYQSLLNRNRQHSHRQVAEMLEAQFADSVEEHPELIAHHYSEAGSDDEATTYWQKAAQKAIQRSAIQEAISHLTRGLETLARLPETDERTERELAFQTQLGPTQMASKGYGAEEVVQAYSRARELCHQLGDTPELFPVLWGLWLFNIGRAENRTAQTIAKQLLELAEESGDSGLVVQAKGAAGAGYYYTGELHEARSLCEAAVELYEPDKHADLAFRFGGLDIGSVSLSYGGLALWLLGYADLARSNFRRAHDLADKSPHPYTRVRVFNWSSLLHQQLGELDTVRKETETAMAAAEEQNFYQVHYWAQILHGWAIAKLGQPADGMAELRRGLEAAEAMGWGWMRPYFMALLGEVCLLSNQAQEGLEAVDEGLVVAEETSEKFFLAELHRLKGELILALGADDARSAAEAEIRSALKVANEQDAKALALRAAMSLVRLQDSQGTGGDGRELLDAIYNDFTEGYRTPDLVEARALLQDKVAAAGT